MGYMMASMLGSDSNLGLGSSLEPVLKSNANTIHCQIGHRYTQDIHMHQLQQVLIALWK